MIPVRNRHPVARLWWLLLPSTGFFMYPEDLTLRERLVWGGPYLLWRAVNKLPVPPFEAMPPVVCNCDYCRGVPGAVFEP